MMVPFKPVFLGICIVWLAAAGSGAFGQLPTVIAAAGDIRGTRDKGSGVRIFRGIPYAVPPLGDLRWRAPQPAPRLSGEFNADKFGAPCMQKVVDTRLPWTEEFMVHGTASEDCLTLNLWAPRKALKPAAVLVFFHGGGFTEGSGAVTSYDGAAIARQGILLVTVNYRLGFFGFFASSALSAESQDHVAGNYGLLDQIAALQWVQRNIAAFGGDPGRVTIAGQSAGAQSVLALMASPRAKGLFRAAIADSGASVTGTSRTVPLADAETAGDRWTATHGNSLAALRTIPAGTLLAATDLPREAFRPLVDGYLLPLGLTEELATPIGSDVPVITGWNADEGSSTPTYGHLSAEAFRAQSTERFGDQQAAFLALYPASTDVEAITSQIAAARDRNFVGAALWASIRSAHRNSPVYLYYFKHVPPWANHPEFGSHHTAELPYFFATLPLVHRDYSGVDRLLSKRLSGLWVEFVNTEHFTAPWPPASSPSGPFLVLDGPLPSENLPGDPARVSFWWSYLQRSTAGAP